MQHQSTSPAARYSSPFLFIATIALCAVSAAASGSLNKEAVVSAAAKTAPHARAAQPAELIHWDEVYTVALERAVSEKRMIFLAVNMDGEAANERMVASVYEDERILKLSRETVNLIASNNDHKSGDRACKRFGTLTCTQHRRVDIEARGSILKPDAKGYVIAPQHVFLGPDLKVLISVPYEITASELEWCFVQALLELDPDCGAVASSRARAPRRLLMGAVADAQDADEQPITLEEALAIIKELKKSSARGGRMTKLKQLVLVDHPDVIDFITGEFRRSSGGGGGRRGGGGGGDANRTITNQIELMHYIGVKSPPSYWEVAVEYIKISSDKVRAEVIVALEQLGAPESLKALHAALSKEKLPEIEKNILRALGACGAEDKRTRNTLLKQSKSKRDELQRRNAIVALGTLAAHADVDEFLIESLEADDAGRNRTAAAVAMALTRNKDWIEKLKVIGKEGDDPELASACRAAIKVLEGETLASIKDSLTRVASDEIERERIFKMPFGGKKKGR